MKLVTFIGDAAVCMGICCFASGVSICRKAWRTKSTSEISPVPLMAGILCTFLWLRYGFYVNDGTMMTVNAVGLGLQTAYLIFYYYVAKHKKTVRKQIAILFSLLTAFLTCMNLVDDAIYWTGLLCCASSLLFSASPLVSVAGVMRTKSTETLPLPMLVFSFCGNLLWFTYGYLIEDKFVEIPNFVSASLCALQLVLFLIYPSSSPKPKSEDQLSLISTPI
ncbi:Sugar transporter SWEET1 [Halotydeus destructor]|nr:Sugar transporter SWEET1 [Halotydeus destructor]